MEEMDFSLLEARVDELIALCDAFARENQVLRQQRKTWRAERADLIERNELAKTKIEAMIGRLKTLDEET